MASRKEVFLKAIELLIDKGHTFTFKEEVGHWVIETYLAADIDEAFIKHFEENKVAIESDGHLYYIKKERPKPKEEGQGYNKSQIGFKPSEE